MWRLKTGLELLLHASRLASPASVPRTEICLDIKAANFSPLNELSRTIPAQAPTWTGQTESVIWVISKLCLISVSTSLFTPQYGRNEKP
ncbi:hypothetical protein RRG08_043359 [Elysia crispata]|uniref:Secreted protein n=1 Tax=Elysia crispata TaxID=231223 RepID=A0AAE0Z5C1_9GAST|nr:hypothetical protein RRG08_043359 [Elysia crispata]